VDISELRVVAALASVLLNVPWMVAVVWVLRVHEQATGPIAGEIWLLPIMTWMATAPLTVASGIAAMVRIRGSVCRLREKWIAILGIVLAATVPAFGLVYKAFDAI
jgi:hypothetical protein